MQNEMIKKAMESVEDWAVACEYRREARMWYSTSKRAGHPADDLLSRVIAVERSAFEAARSAVAEALPHVALEPLRPRYGVGKRPADWQDISGKSYSDGVQWTICGWDFCFSVVRGWHFESDTMRGIRLADEMLVPRTREAMAMEVLSYINRCVPARTA